MNIVITDLNNLTSEFEIFERCAVSLEFLENSSCLDAFPFLD